MQTDHPPQTEPRGGLTPAPGAPRATRMPSAPPVSTVPPPAAPASPPPAKWRGCLFYGCGTLAVLAGVIVASILITLWWVRRPLKPVELSPPEKAAVEQKLQRLGNRPAPAVDPAASAEARAPQERRYEPGARTLRLTEREINGLLNANTDLGRSVRLELAQDAIQAYLAVRLPPDFPVGGGQVLRARGRFRLSLGHAGEPCAMLEDVTVLGLSLPNAWLGGLKGQNLLGQALGERPDAPLLRGLKSLRIEPGALTLEVED